MSIFDDLDAKLFAKLDELSAKIDKNEDDDEEDDDIDEEDDEENDDDDEEDDDVDYNRKHTPKKQNPQMTTPPPIQNNQASQTTSTGSIYGPEMESLIELALVDGKLTEKEKNILFKRAQAKGIDLDEFEMVLDARLYQINQQQQQQQQASPSTPKSNKHGDVKKCPACGAIIAAYSTRCRECGHDFSNIAANNSIQKLFEMLNKVEEKESSFFKSFWDDDEDKIKQKKTIIQNFPIPTTKDDILEFLALAVPLARKPGFFSEDEDAREMYPVWRAKCEQIIMKAKFSMMDDSKTLEMIKEYANELKIKM